LGGTLHVTPAPLTVTADDKSKVYGSANPVLTASYSGFVNGDTSAVVSGLTLSTTATTASHVGAYAITAAGATASDYTIASLDVTLTVPRAPLTIQADAQSMTFGSVVPPLTAAFLGLVNGDTSSAVPGLQLTPSPPPPSLAGPYAIVPAG